MNWKRFKDGVANYEDSRSGFLGVDTPGEFTGRQVEAEILLEKRPGYKEALGDNRGFGGPAVKGYSTGEMVLMWGKRVCFEVRTPEGNFWVDDTGAAVRFKDDAVIKPEKPDPKTAIFEIGRATMPWDFGLYKNGQHEYDFTPEKEGCKKADNLSWEDIKNSPFIPQWLKDRVL